MSKKAFGTTSKGVEASLYEISNGGGLRVLLTDYGASVVSIFVTLCLLHFVLVHYAFYIMFCYSLPGSISIA